MPQASVFCMKVQQSFQERSREICPDKKACFAPGMDGFRETGNRNIKSV